jgi:thiaminase/transcriptional activator TenA
MPFSDQLRHAAADVWQAQHEHPFVRGIGDGTLDPERFRFYVRQDYLFLIEYGRLLALACARAPRLELIERFAELAHSTLRTEMDLHRAYAADWGISREQLERERPHTATRA